MRTLGWMPALAVVAACGLLLVALGNGAARDGEWLAQPLFWTGLVAIYAPIAFRLLSSSASRAERVALVSLLGLALFVVKVLYSPSGFVFYDELGWWRATHDLLRSGDPFSSNPLVISTPGFPGLDLLAGPLADLADLDLFAAGTIVAAAMRLTLMLALFLFLERATRSSRAAGIGVALYACNPSFVYFSAQFAYETVALVIGLALLLMTIRWSERNVPPASAAGKALIVAMALLAATLTVTHHMTAYAVLAFLIGWALLRAHAQRGGDEDAGHLPLQGPALPAILLGAMASAWFALVAGGVTITELGDTLGDTIGGAVDLVFGGSGPKRPFEAGGQSNTLLARAIAVASVLILLASVPLGLKRTWQRGDALQRALGLAALLYVVTLGLRATQSGTETSQRASEFVFVGLAFLVAVLVSELRLPRRAGPRARATLALSGVATLLLVGGFIIGEPPQGRQPGPFLVAAERRSIGAQGLAAARFAAARLPAGSRILIDHANAMLLGSYGDVDPVTRRVDGIHVSRVFLGPVFQPAARQVIRRGRIDYLVVDRRLSRTPPVGGYYFTRTEPESFARTEPIQPEALDKFPRVPGLTKVYGNGAIAIYDTTGMRR